MGQRGLYPSVTEILEACGLAPDLSMVKPDVLAWASARGTALHRAIELHTKGTLDVDSLHPEIVGALSGYLKFVEDSGHEAVASELELIHPTWGFMGHPDRVGTLAKLEELCLIDWKMTASFSTNYVRHQLAGYKLLWNAVNPDRPVRKVFGLHLKKDGRYNLHDVTDAEAEQAFLAAVVVHKAQRRK
jgi:hypothetical protein